jgi:hypothetical protein
LQWEATCAVVFFLCFFHGLLLISANYQLRISRDLAVEDNSEAERRTIYIRITTAMLSSMALVVAIPLLVLAVVLPFSTRNWLEALLTASSGVFTLVAAFRRTKGRVCMVKTPRGSGSYPGRRLWVWLFANSLYLPKLLAHLIAFGVPLSWLLICFSNTHYSTAVGQLPHNDLAGLAFAFRCIHPFTGVSPLVPVLLLLFCWYLWGIFQTWRLRFSEAGRPRRPLR